MSANLPPRNIKEPAADTPLSGDEISALIDPVLSAGPVALAVSGGPDSMQLMHMAAAQKGAASVHVLSVDHQLRDGSAVEAAFVEKEAHKLGLEHTTLRWEHSTPDSGLQERARAARYTLMAQWCRENHFEHLVTAHNLDDQAETLLMRLGRGSGPDGLAAMARQKRLFSISVVRPLLEVPHSRLVASLKAAGHEYIDDPSNTDLRFERVRIRNARAARDELGLSDKALAATARRMGRAVEALSQVTDELIIRSVQLSKYGHCSVKIGSVLDAPDEVTHRLLSACLTAIGGADWPPVDSQLEDIRDWLSSDAPKPRTLAGCRLVVRKGELIIGREAGRIGEKDVPVKSPGTFIWDGRFEVSVSGAVPEGLTVCPVGAEDWAGLKKSRPPLPAFVGQSLPAICRNGKLFVVPLLELPDDGCTAGVQVSTQFIGKIGPLAVN